LPSLTQKDNERRDEGDAAQGDAAAISALNEVAADGDVFGAAADLSPLEAVTMR
jgi:hypothetical protein